jgi:hypothetical protein
MDIKTLKDARAWVADWKGHPNVGLLDSAIEGRTFILNLARERGDKKKAAHEAKLLDYFQRLKYKLYGSGKKPPTLAVYSNAARAAYAAVEKAERTGSVDDYLAASNLHERAEQIATQRNDKWSAHDHGMLRTRFARIAKDMSIKQYGPLKSDEGYLWAMTGRRAGGKRRHGQPGLGKLDAEVRGLLRK